MPDNTAYDISNELEPLEKLDDIQAKLEARRKAKHQPSSASKEEADQESKLAQSEEQRRSEEKRKAKLKRERQEKVQLAREKELSDSAWVTCRHKVKEKRIELLDRIFLRMKADGDFTGTKQEFYDEGFALLEEKYAIEVLKWQSAK